MADTSQHGGAEPASTSGATVRSIDELQDWSRRTGIPTIVVCSLQLEEVITAGEPAWIAADFWCCSDDELELALQHATQLIIAEDLDKVCGEAARLAEEGERVVMLEWPQGEPIPLPRRWVPPTPLTESRMK